MVHVYTTAFWWAAGIFAAGLLLAIAVLPRTAAPPTRQGETVRDVEPAIAAEQS